MHSLLNFVFGPSSSRFASSRASLGLLALRVVVGAAFVLHGMDKIKKPFGWMPAGSPVPGPLQALAALAEFGGGLALIFGLLTPLAALGIFFTMLVALLMVHLPAGRPFVSAKPGGGSYEDVAFYMAATLALMFVGPGRFSLDAILFRGRNESARSR